MSGSARRHSLTSVRTYLSGMGPETLPPANGLPVLPCSRLVIVVDCIDNDRTIDVAQKTLSSVLNDIHSSRI